MKAMRRILALLFAGLAAAGLPCTIFVVARNGQVLVGANEDFGRVTTSPRHWVQFHPKKPGEKYGYIAFGFPAYPDFPQAAINEAGVFYDYNALKRLDIGRPGKPPFSLKRLEEVMTQCGTVREVVAHFEKFDDEPLSTGQMVVADAKGDSAIIERHTHTDRGASDYQIGTNFRTSTTPKDAITCPRWKACDAELSKKRPASIESVRALCEEVKASRQGGYTSYTTVCDLKAAKVYLFRGEDFEKVAAIDVKQTLKKGERRVDMDVLMTELGKNYP